MSYPVSDTQDYSSGYDTNPSIASSFSNPSNLFPDKTEFATGLSIDYNLWPIDALDIADISLGLIDQGLSNRVGEYLRAFASSSAYEEITGLAFSENYNQTVSESIRQRFAEGSLENLPQVQVLDDNILNGANGAYAADLNTIFLSNTFITNSSHQAIAKVLLEEIGHFIDAQINEADSPGDEGDIFARLVLGQDLCLNELAYLKQEDDSGYLWLNGQSIAVEQDNTLSTARNMGSLVGSRTFTDWVGSTDTNDYYRFDIGTASNFNLNLTGLSADADVQLLNSAGTILQGAYAGGTSSEYISRQLSAGTYYARVYRFSGDTTYNLALNATPLDYAGNILSTARNIGTLSGTRSFTDWVGSVDTNDYYRFDVSTTRNFSLSLTGLSADANVRLLNSAGTVLQGAYLTGNSAESISRQLGAGTYYAQVYRASGNTNYSLSLSATPLDYAGNTLSAARNVGTLVGSRTLTDWVGSVDTNDYYRFYVGTTSNFRLNLTGLSADANVRLLNSAGSVLQGSYLTGNSAESISRQLSAGTYYAQVYRASGDTTYNLTLNATAISPDLVIQSPFAPSSVTVGNTVNINSYTRNQGTTSAGYSYVRYWLSDDVTLNTSSDRFLGNNYVGSLAAGTSEYDSFSFIYDASWGTGTKYIFFEADGYNYVTESNESNNVASAAITVSGTSGYVPPTYQAFDANQVFSLHSYSSANHTIYLDFDGHTTTNTSWNSSYGSSIATPAYDIDGNNTSFSTDERRNIWNVWRRVSEDFIPFNVNVTTAAPVLSDLIKSDSSDTRWGIRVVIGGNGSWLGGRYGGVAYLNSFNWNSDTPTFVFSENLYSEKSIAEAVSHEVGHTLGLSHDGVTGGPEYYEGHNGWASIMGVGYYQELTQWSSGQYSGASNTQDDLAIITGNNGFGYRSDDYGSSLSTASSLVFNGSTVRTYGIVERNTDVDWFRLDSSGGNLSLNINAFEIGANLDILARLYDSSGQIIATYNPTDSLSVLISRYLSLGTYYLSIQGTGKGDLTTGYGNYGSLGQYLLTGTIV